MRDRRVVIAKLTDVVLLTPPARLWYLLYMRANLGTIPKYRITFTHNSPSDDPAPDDLGLERQPDGGWHLWSGSEAFAGITIPAEAVEHLVAVMSKIRFDPVEDAPEPLSSGGRWTYNAYRATLLRDGLRFAMVTPDGSNALSPEAAGELLVALNGSEFRFEPVPVEKAPEPPAPVSPDPGYRIVVPGERIQSGDLWKYPDGTGVPADFTVGQKLEPDNSAILQRLDPDAVAPGHNPDRLTVAQVGIADGWRLLTEEETEEFAHSKVAPTEYWMQSSNEWVETDRIWYATPASTLRTKAEKLEVVS